MYERSLFESLKFMYSKNLIAKLHFVLIDEMTNFPLGKSIFSNLLNNAYKSFEFSMISVKTNKLYFSPTLQYLLNNPGLDLNTTCLKIIL